MIPSEWVKSSYSNAGGSCVEARRRGRAVQHGPLMAGAPLPETGVTRLTVNIGPRTAEAINWTMTTYGVSLTEALRRVVANGYVITRKAVEDGVDIQLHGPSGWVQEMIIAMPDGQG